MSRPIDVLVVDDSPLVRQVIRKILLDDKAFGRVESAPNGKLALRRLKKFDADVVTLDVQMPVMDGLATLRRIMRKAPRPVIMFSAFTMEGADKTIKAMELGAVDFIQKPVGRLSNDIRQVGRELIAKAKAVVKQSRAQRRRRPTSDELTERLAETETAHTPPQVVPSRGGKIIAIGASTGGTEAIRQILTQIPESCGAAIVVVQHMPEGFTGAFASRLDQLCALQVKEAAHRDLVRPGRALIAPGHSHMIVGRDDPHAFVTLHRRAEVSGHRPSVDVLMASVAETFGKDAIGVLLTGMGRDGAAGMGQIQEAGGLTIAQDEDSCVVYGMPRVAVAEGSVQIVAHLHDIPAILQRSARRDESN